MNNFFLSAIGGYLFDRYIINVACGLILSKESFSNLCLRYSVASETNNLTFTEHKSISLYYQSYNLILMKVHLFGKVVFRIFLVIMILADISGHVLKSVYVCSLSNTTPAQSAPAKTRQSFLQRVWRFGYHGRRGD